MRKVSKKRAALNRQIMPKRRKYLQGRKCVIDRISGLKPMYQAAATEIHEIVGGRFRHLTFQDPRFWLPTERINHTQQLQDMPKPRQWALKLLFDPKNFDLAALSELPGSVVDPGEVLLEIKVLMQNVIELAH